MQACDGTGARRRSRFSPPFCLRARTPVTSWSAARHAVSWEEIDAMYDAGRWVVADDPLGRPSQERLVGEVPGSGRLITVAVEWVERQERNGSLGGWQRRPIS